MDSLTCISLFSGGMGLDIGLERAGFSIKLAVDNMSAAVETARANRPDLPVFDRDIRELTAEKARVLTGFGPDQLDLLAGGPPCQSFSTAGKRLGLDDQATGPLVFEFVRLVEELRPRAFILRGGLYSKGSSGNSSAYSPNSS